MTTTRVVSSLKQYRCHRCGRLLGGGSDGGQFVMKTDHTTRTFCFRCAEPQSLADCLAAEVDRRDAERRALIDTSPGPARV